MHPKLYYCNTVYQFNPPQDINPLILELYHNGHILALCARDGIVARINKFVQTKWYQDKYPNQILTFYGWWEAITMGLISKDGKLIKDELNSHDAVIIIGRNRIDKMFHPLLRSVEKHLRTPTKPCA